MSESSKGIDLSTHPLVAGHHPDPDDFKDLASFTGYLGPAKKEGYIRLYLDLTFKHYYELPSDAVLATRPSKAGDPQSPTIVTIKGEAKLSVVNVTSTITEASFLQGSISKGYLPAAAQSQAVGGVTPDCVCILASIAVSTLAAARPAAVGCACFVASVGLNTLAAARPAAVGCACFVASVGLNTLAAARPAAVGCVCILSTLNVNTLAAARPAAVDCACILASVGLNTLAAARPAMAFGPLCCNVTFTLGACTEQGPSLADARALLGADGCIQLTGTTVCTPTGIPYLCPGAVG
ncbi:hypothetical protein [Sorangium sp. So ce1389]|uniref:hypothetical protein n=1 Tax=Sorangium sp. So ce1389 TaxID=3133336 RepID=UPI003F5DA973